MGITHHLSIYIKNEKFRTIFISGIIVSEILINRTLQCNDDILNRPQQSNTHTGRQLFTIFLSPYVEGGPRKLKFLAIEVRRLESFSSKCETF